MAKRYMYYLERIRDCHDWPKGTRIWANHRCTGWRVIDKNGGVKMNMMKVIVYPGKVGLHPKIQEGKHYLIDRNSIWFGNGGNSYGSVYDMNGNYISDMNLKCFTSV